jgi:hypothetical protein
MDGRPIKKKKRRQRSAVMSICLGIWIHDACIVCMVLCPDGRHSQVLVDILYMSSFPSLSGISMSTSIHPIPTLITYDT